MKGEREMAVKYVIFNRTTNRQEVQAVYPSLSDCNAAITRYKKSRPPQSQNEVLAAVQVES
jgi:hypothetical protein